MKLGNINIHPGGMIYYKDEYDMSAMATMHEIAMQGNDWEDSKPVECDESVNSLAKRRIDNAVDAVRGAQKE
jgi:hypothetical protein